MLKLVSFVASAVLLPGAAAWAAEEVESPFVVRGRIVDVAGDPVAGVEVGASCGMGSLFHTGTAKTDDAGRYRLEFGPGIAGADTKLGVGTQVATITPRLHGWYEIHLGRRGNLLMTDAAEPLAADDMRCYAGVVAAGKPYELNFTMIKAGTIHGRLVNEFGGPVPNVEIDLTGDILPPSCSVLGSARTDADGRFTFDDVPVWLADPSIRLKWRFMLRPFGVRHELETDSFEVSSDEASLQELSLESAGDKGEVRLTLHRRTASDKK